MKNQLRIKSLEIRKKLNIQEISTKVKKNLYSLNEFKQAKNILAYYSFGSEISTESYFEDKSKNWFLPKINGNNLLVCPYDKNNLIKNKYNINEPATKSIENINMIDIIIIPALGADINGYRIGYGKGYYDRFLNSLNFTPVTIILTCEKLIYKDIFPDEYDVKCSIIVTDKGIYRIKC